MQRSDSSTTPYPSRLSSWYDGGQHHLYLRRHRFPQMRPVNRLGPSLVSSLPPAELMARGRGLSGLTRLRKAGRECAGFLPFMVSPPFICARPHNRIRHGHTAHGKIWSGKRVSNSRPQPWQGCALPTELFPLERVADRHRRRIGRGRYRYALAMGAPVQGTSPPPGGKSVRSFFAYRALPPLPRRRSAFRIVKDQYEQPIIGGKRVFWIPKRKNPGSAFCRHQRGSRVILGRCLVFQVTSRKCPVEVTSYQSLYQYSRDGNHLWLVRS